MLPRDGVWCSPGPCEDPCLNHIRTQRSKEQPITPPGSGSGLLPRASLCSRRPPTLSPSEARCRPWSYPQPSTSEDRALVRSSSPSPSQQPESHTAHHPVTSLFSRPSTFPTPVHPGPAHNLLAVLQRGQAQSHQQDTVLAVPSQGDVLPQMCTWLTPSSPRLYPNIAGGGLPDGPTPYLILPTPPCSLPPAPSLLSLRAQVPL